MKDIVLSYPKFDKNIIILKLNSLFKKFKNNLSQFGVTEYYLCNIISEVDYFTFIDQVSSEHPKILKEMSIKWGMSESELINIFSSFDKLFV